MKKNSTILVWQLSLLAPLAIGCGSTTDESTSPDDGTGSPDDMAMGVDPDSSPTPELGRIPCGDLETSFEGDELCIEPPEPGEGIQLHMGPTDYDDPDEVAPFLIEPGVENTQCFSRPAGNDEVFYFYEQYYRMRPGSHHLFVNMSVQGDAVGWRENCDATAMLIGGTQESVSDFPPGGVRPPEDENLGRPLIAGSNIDFQAHFVNTTDDAILREAWVNFMAVERNEETRILGGIGLFGGLMAEFAPGSNTTHGYSCENSVEDRRVVSLFGHRHAHATRFSAYVNRGGERELVYEDYDWHEPTELAYNTLQQNPTPDPVGLVPGGASGILTLGAGDSLEWECDVVNDSEETIRWGNYAYDAEMCNLFGSIVADGGPPMWTCFPELN